MTIITAAQNLIGFPLTIENKSGRYVKVSIETGYNLKNRTWGIGFDHIWLAPKESIEGIDQSKRDHILISVHAVYTENIDNSRLFALNDANHDVSIEPKIISVSTKFEVPDALMIREDARSLSNDVQNVKTDFTLAMRNADYLPIMTITHDAAKNQPQINFPRDAKSLQAAIAQLKKELLPHIQKELREALPQLPCGQTEKGGAIGIISDYL